METEKNKNLNGSSAGENSAGRNTYVTGAHLSPEELTAYQYGNFSSPEIENQMQNHLIECRRCTNLLLELNEFAADTASDSFSQKNTDAQWAKFEQKNLAAQSKISAQTVMPEEQSNTKSLFWWLPAFNLKPATALTVLACLITGAILTVIFLKTRNAETDSASIIHNPPTISNTFPVSNTNGSKEEKVESNQTSNIANNAVNQSVDQNLNSPKRSVEHPQNAAPRIKKIDKYPTTNSNAPKSLPNPERRIAPENEVAQNRIDVSLYPAETLRGDAADRRIVRVNQNLVEQIRLKLNAPKSNNFSDYSIEILSSQNKSILTLPILPDRRGDFYLSIPLDKLPADTYSLKIYSEKDKVHSLSYEYEFELIYE